MRKAIWLLPLAGALGMHAMQGSASLQADKVHSSVVFSVGYAGGLSQIKGMFTEFKVEMTYDEADITKSTVTAEIQPSSVLTGSSGRDKHLQSPDFFDAEKNPTFRFVSKKVSKDGDKLTVTGDFTMRGVTKEISFPFKVVGKRVDTQSRLPMFGFQGTAVIKRSEFGMSWGLANGAIPDEVTVEISVLMKQKEAATFVSF